MREKFSAVIMKPVYTFAFNRQTRVSPNLYYKLKKARNASAGRCGAVRCSASGAVQC